MSLLQKKQNFTASFDGGGKPPTKKTPEQKIDEEHHQLDQPSDAPDAPDATDAAKTATASIVATLADTKNIVHTETASMLSGQ